jgi:hypothetical protein
MRRSPRWFAFGFTCSLAAQAVTALLWVQWGEYQRLLVLSETVALLLDFIALSIWLEP